MKAKADTLVPTHTLELANIDLMFISPLIILLIDIKSLTVTKLKITSGAPLLVTAGIMAFLP